MHAGHDSLSDTSSGNLQTPALRLCLGSRLYACALHPGHWLEASVLGNACSCCVGCILSIYSFAVEVLT